MDVAKRSTRGKQWAALAAIAMAAALLHACGGGGGGVGGVAQFPGSPPRPFPGPGINSGLVAAKGSLIVNGVEFRAGTPGTVRIDNATVSETAVRQGMVVKMRGAFGPLDNEGAYDNVVAEPQVIGQVSGLAGSAFTVLGQTVTVTPATIFDVPANRVLVSNDIVEVHGFFSGTNAIEATFIQRDAPGTTKRQVRGVVGGSAAGTFSIGTQQVNLGTVTPVPADGDFVEVEGTQAVPGGPLQATKIEIDNFSAQGDQEVETEGSVASHNAGDNSFVLRSLSGPVTVRYHVPGFAVTAFQLEERNTPSDAATVLAVANQQVEVEGRLVGGVLQAREVELRRTENVVLEGNVTGVSGSNFTLLPFGIALTAPAGQMIPSDGNRVEVGGTVVPGATSITVTRVTPLPAGTRVFIKGPVTAHTLPTMMILGITVDTTGLQPADDPSLGLPSEFENAANRRITRGEFYAQIVPLVTVVRAKAQLDPSNPPFTTGGVFHPRAGVEIEGHR